MTKFGKITQGRAMEHISKGHPGPYRKGAVHSNFWSSFLFMHTPLTQNYQTWCGNTCYEGLVLGVSHAPPEGGGVPALPNMGGSFLIVYTFFCRTNKFDVVTRKGKGLVLSGQPHISL